VLPLTDDGSTSRPQSVPQEQALTLSTFQPNIQSCPNLSDCSKKIDKFNDD